jgi:diguanylate cyclase (GGDEF)-like protein
MPGYSVGMSIPDSPSNPLQVATLVPLSTPTVIALAASGFGPFSVRACTQRDDVLAPPVGTRWDALILADDGSADAADAAGIAAEAALDTALLVVVPALDPPVVLAWLARGAQDVMRRDELEAPSLPQRIRAAIERKRIERKARKAYATDLETGLPHQQQLVEHMSHLLALREREPSPMAVLALRIEGLATTEARLGREASNVLRRRVAVRLRAGVRASDVVASLGDDSFAVLLGALLVADDAQRVGAKLMASLLKPFPFAGSEVTVAVALGIGQYPQDGTQPEALLRRAVGLAVSTAAQGRAGFANFVESGGQAPAAANDD